MSVLAYCRYLQLTSESQGPDANVHHEGDPSLEILGGNVRNGECHMVALRTRLCEMFRITQLAVDYATKAYEFQRLEFTAHAAYQRCKLENLVQTVLMAAANVRERKHVCERDHSSKKTARTISLALARTYYHALEISAYSAEFLVIGGYEPAQYIITIAHFVNSAMRRCAIAFLNEESIHAESALREIDEWRRGERASKQNSLVKTTEALERRIAARLHTLLEHIYDLALALNNK